MQCNSNSLIQIIHFHGLFRNAPQCRKTGACRILVPFGTRQVYEVTMAQSEHTRYWAALTGYHLMKKD